MKNLKTSSADSHLPLNLEAGGDIEDWNFIDDLGLSLEETYPAFGGKEMEIQQCLYKNPYGQNPFCIDLNLCKSLEELINKIKNFAEDHTSLSQSVIDRRISYMYLMAGKKDKQVFPINWLNPSNTQYQYHMNWYRTNVYKKKNNKNFYGLKQRKQAMEFFLESVGISKDYFAYRLPKEPPLKPIYFPNPDLAYKIAKAKYNNDKNLNWIIQFMHVYNFTVGPRAPSEMCHVKLSGIDWENHRISFPQPKRNWKIRTVQLDPMFFNGKTVKSLKNYVDYHRYDSDNEYLFVNKSGKLFEERNLANNYLSLAKKIDGKYHPYCGRHFCATGQLILNYLKKHPDPLKKTMHFMDHDKSRTTERYTQLSEEYFEHYKFDWFMRILKDRFYRGKYAENRNSEKTPLFRLELLGEGVYSPDQIRTGD